MLPCSALGLRAGHQSSLGDFPRFPPPRRDRRLPLMSKKLIICADGTWNTQDDSDHDQPSPTNVEKIARALRTSSANGSPQVIHYESGVGTDPGFKLRGGTVGRGLWADVLSCYRFLVHNFCAGDSIHLFGFSRGAYTARSVAGLVRNSGVLRSGHEDHERRAVDLYRDYAENTAPTSRTCVEFRRAHSHEPDIDFIGVWDTVGSLGIPGLDGSFRILKGLDWQFHDVTLSSRVWRARQALAIHEHRAQFVPTLWEQQPAARDAGQTLVQMWFTGAHSDVGGGYPEHGLSDVALQWMIGEAEAAGLSFGMDALPGFAPDPHAAPHDSFGTLWKLLGFFGGKPRGAIREWRPRAETCEQIHPSVRDRFAHHLEGDKWPESFATALKAR